MVEITGGKRKEAETKKLKTRVLSLSRELDALESAYQKSSRAFETTVKVLSGLLEAEMSAEVLSAIDDLKKVVAAKKVDPKELDRAVKNLKHSLVTQDESEQGPKETLETKAAGRHVALALLAGMRLGHAQFDSSLEKAIARITSCINQGNIRAAMTYVADIMQEFKEVSEVRRLKAEEALAEIYEEVLTTEQELASMFSSATRDWVKTGSEFDKKVTASLGKLAEGLKSDDNLEALKASVLNHVRTLRETIRSRKSQEQAALEKTRQELKSLRNDLVQATQKMQKMQEESKRLGKEATTDPMTGVLNKRAFSNLLDKHLANPAAQPVSLIVFDIDYFKRINDRFGHQAGDRALKAIAEQASSSLRGDDVLFRYAGDEFVIVLPKTQTSDAGKVAERVRLAAEKISFSYKGENHISITISLGLSQSIQGDKSDTLFERADQALLEAKEQGRNRVNVK
jgi:diguanylate cyclase (GGDEF)-like protein